MKPQILALHPRHRFQLLRPGEHYVKVRWASTIGFPASKQVKASCMPIVCKFPKLSHGTTVNLDGADSNCANSSFHAHACRSRAIPDRLDSETEATDAVVTKEGNDYARRVTNTLLPVVRVDISGQAKSARITINLSIALGVLTDPVTTCAENTRHGSPTRSCRMLAIRKKS